VVENSTRLIIILRDQNLRIRVPIKLKQRGKERLNIVPRKAIKQVAVKAE